MNARGSTEVIVATIGLSMGALSQNLFTMIVTMAVITTMAMPPTLRWALSRLPMRKDEKQRLEREEMEEKGFVSKMERLLLAVDESDNAKLATRIVGLIAGAGAMPTTVMHIKNDKKTGKVAVEAAKQKAEEVGKTVQEFAERVERTQKPEEKSDTTLDVTTIVETAAKSKAVAEEAEKGYSLMIIGLEKTVARRNEFHEDITKLAAGFEGPLAVVDARDKLLEHPLGAQLNMLVPVNGTEYSRRAAEVAIAIARASHAPLTALYVAPRGRKRSRRYEEAILKDISKLAETYDTDVTHRGARQRRRRRCHSQGVLAQAIQSDRDRHRPPAGREAFLRRHRRRACWKNRSVRCCLSPASYSASSALAAFAAARQGAELVVLREALGRDTAGIRTIAAPVLQFLHRQRETAPGARRSRSARHPP